MRIAFVYDFLFPFHIGGAEIRTYKLALYMAKHPEVERVDMIGVKMWDGPDHFIKDGIHYHGVCRYQSVQDGKFGGRRMIRDALRYGRSVRAWLRQHHDLDIVDISAFPYAHLHDTIAEMEAGKMQPVVTWHQFWGPYWKEYMGSLIGKAGMRLERKIARIPAQHVCVSTDVQDSLRQAGCQPGTIKVVPNGVDANLIDGPSRPHSERDIDVIFVGRLTHQKNVGLFIDAVAHLARGAGGGDGIKRDADRKGDTSSLQCAIVGDGPLRKQLQKQAAKRGVEHRIRFYGAIPPPQVHTLLQRSKTFILPSRQEGQGGVVLEAMAARVPVITVDAEQNAAQTQVQHGRTGFIVQAQAEVVAACVQRILTDPGKRQEIGDAGHRYASARTWDVTCTQMLQIYWDLMNRREND
ncbi:MAG: glycosyltransferase family 4 protein [Nanoarchaeota archaeon]